MTSFYISASDNCQIQTAFHKYPII